MKDLIELRIKDSAAAKQTTETKTTQFKPSSDSICRKTLPTEFSLTKNQFIFTENSNGLASFSRHLKLNYCRYQEVVSALSILEKVRNIS